MQLIFDTGSSWLWLPLLECGADCHEKAQLFDNKASTTYQKQSNSPTHIQYGGGSVWGNKAQDTICLDRTLAQTCMNRYNFLSVFSTNDLQGLQSDGILGLAPGTQNTDADLFLDRLLQQGMIQQRLFSFSLGGTDETSMVTFGGFNLTKYSKVGEGISWNKLLNDDYWTIRIQDAKLGNYTFDLDTHQAIVDTGTSYILMPEDDFNEFRKVIEPGRSCYFDTGKSDLFTCSCLLDTHKNFPDFHIQLDGGRYYTVPSTSYMTRQNFKCYFKIVSQGLAAQAPFWILGDAFMLNYYTVFDLDNRRVGFAGSTHVDRVHYWYDILLVASILLALFGTISFLYQWYMERKGSQAQPVVLESEMSENPSLRSQYHPVRIEDVVKQQTNNQSHILRV